jgi:hypothetical protein
MVEQVIVKLELIVGMHKAIPRNVEKAQQKQKKTYLLQKGRQIFRRFVTRKDMVKIVKKPCKKKTLEAS